MFRPRIIPVLLLKNNGLVKSKKFKNFRYIGDPINAVKIFNDLKADELVFLDIFAGTRNDLISLHFIKKVGEEANMPFACGGGIRSISQIRDILSAGAEKVVINTQAVQKPGFVKEASDEFGSSTIIVCMDVKRDFFKRRAVYSKRATEKSSFEPFEFAQLMEEMGAGEIILQSVDLDGEMQGYDLELLKEISNALTIPVVALGGAGSIADMKTAVVTTGCNAVAAGSMFVYHGARHGILINYPDDKTKRNLFE